ncbi:Site-specific recombinase XerD [Flavobacterium fryxellicola]|uniref:Recombinase n=1 Tax=Flavobacterium fryxellicola TaxID=249352 RepID=A0A167U7E8_9FLAO|nr:site-specific integrase [Flavobacterium fryxellicola]OAB25330.1 recombinase [Flavobacterium fryxellicola]SHN75086.1 Site-specific recombinase XerD [Flavobacterium fryxellicola]
MKTKITVLYYLRKSKVNAQAQMPIYQRITINGQRFDCSSGHYVDEAKWSSEASKMKGNSEEARMINGQLDIMRATVYETEKKLFMNQVQITYESFKNEYQGKKERERMLIPIFVEHNRKIKELVGFEYAPGTLERYQTSLKHTKDFLFWKYNLTDINIEKIDHAFIMEYEFYLRSVRKCNNNTAVKYVKNFHKIINQCLSNGWLNKDPFVNYKAKVKEVIREFLSEADIESMINKEFVSERLDLVRDIFVFSCFTGLAYIDVKQLTKTHISLGIDGDNWIFTTRQKTDTASKIPLLPLAQQIVDKYEKHPVCLNENRLLPILSNQKMNAYLKEIADVCGINKDLTFHIARHTFATTVTLSNGVPIETVSKMLGHTNLKTTQHYAKILDHKISNDMMILKEKFKNTNTALSNKSGQIKA